MANEENADGILSDMVNLTTVESDDVVEANDITSITAKGIFSTMHNLTKTDGSNNSSLSKSLIGWL